MSADVYRTTFPELNNPDAIAVLTEAENEVRKLPSTAPATVSVAQTLNDPAPSPSQGNGVSLLPASTVLAPQSLPERFGRYRILRKLGQGGMGTVYLAHDTELDRQVALKVPQFSDNDPEAQERFVREARSAAMLSHPNLCPVYDVGRIDNIHYLTMAFLEGATLSAHTDKQSLLSPRDAVALVRQLALALDEAHRKGIIHRDLKPSNVMLNGRGEPVLMDFGLARRTSAGDARLTRSGTIMGTPAYMSPEQVEGDIEAHGPATDVYSLGVILFELLVGELPFQGSIGVIMSQILTQDPPSLTKRRVAIDPTLDALCHRALAKKPGDRFGSMKEFADALDAWLQRSEKPSGGGLVRWIAAALVLIGLAVAGVVFFVNTKQGQIRIEVNDPAAAVLVDGEEVRIDKLGEPITLKPGKHGLIVKRGDVIVETRDFTVVRGENPVLKITLTEKQEPIKPPAEPVFRSIFNGKDLSGWIIDSGDPEAWSVVEGELVLHSNTKDRGWLLTNSTFSDFVLRFEYQMGGQANSGVSFRSQKGEGRTAHDSPKMAEIQLLHDPHPIYESLGPIQKTGTLFGLAVGQAAKLKSPDEWNTFEMEARGPSLRVAINGSQTLQTDLRTFENSYQKIPSLNRTSGRIGLQNWEGLTKFRKIEVKELTASSPPEKLDGFRSLFNGKDLSGWAAELGAGVDVTKTFSVKDGVLICTGRPFGYLYTENAYKNYHLRFDWRYPRPAGLVNEDDFDGNTGVFIYAAPGSTPWPTSIKVHGVNREHGKMLGVGGVTVEQAFDPVALKKARLPVGEWNTTEIVCKDGSITVKVNGVEVNKGKTDRAQGAIALQSERSQVEFRSIAIKEE